MANTNINTDKKFIFKIVNPRIAVIILTLVVIIFIGIFVFLNYQLFQKINWLESIIQIPGEKTEVIPKVPKITVPKVLYNLAGLIKKMENRTIFLEASIPQVDENGNPSQITEIRKITVKPDAKISRLTFVAQEGTDEKVPKENQITLADLKIGDYIEVISNKDISQETEFEVVQVRLLPKI